MKGRVCSSCKSEINRNDLDQNYAICPVCGNYMRFHAKKRILSLADKNTFQEWDSSLKIPYSLNDTIYIEKLKDTSNKYKLSEAIITGEMKLHGYHTAIGVMDTRFLMASMGQVVGEKVTRLFERASKQKLPVILFCCSGGARMQEGIVSLMQMEKTSAAVKRHHDAGLLYVSVLTNPTMGGVTASFAMLADIILAEPGAMIGFAGPRVIEQNTGVTLPEGFQTAEFQKQHGFVDAIVSREEMQDYFRDIFDAHHNEHHLFGHEHALRKHTFQSVCENQCNRLTSWEKVQIARAKERPTSMDYIHTLFDSFYEFSGDRISGDDGAIVGGIAKFHHQYVTVIGHQKGKQTIEEAISCNFGMPSPAGYRKALRLMKQAEKFHRPIICFIDTIGAACGKEAEEQGQGAVIANLLQQMSGIRVPILSIVIGEGGSGGALALGVGNEVWMLENAVYAILTPEGYASILWKDNSKAKEAAEIMKLGATDLYQMHIIDKIIPEKEPITRDHMESVCETIENEISTFLKSYRKKSGNKLVKQRYERFRKY